MINKHIAFFFLLGLFLPHLVTAQCTNDNHSTNPKDSWLSCQTSALSEDLANESYHWIYYDLGYQYSIGTVKIWNYNVTNETGKGIKDGEVFYSQDGQNWTSGGTFQIPEASGTLDYTGWEGIDLEGERVRFITITAYSNWGNRSCTGLSEVRFNIVEQTTSFREEFKETLDLLVFPNPTYRTLFVNLKNQQLIEELIVINSAGHEMLRQKVANSEIMVDVHAFPVGMYLLKIQTDHQEYLVHKFLKMDYD